MYHFLSTSERMLKKSETREMNPVGITEAPHPPSCSTPKEKGKNRAMEKSNWKHDKETCYHFTEGKPKLREVV
jgi:hypothetical protein